MARRYGSSFAVLPLWFQLQISYGQISVCSRSWWPCFLFHDELLVHAQVADPKEELTSSQTSAQYFIKKFPAMLPKKLYPAETPGRVCTLPVHCQCHCRSREWISWCILEGHWDDRSKWFLALLPSTPVHGVHPHHSPFQRSLCGGVLLCPEEQETKEQAWERTLSRLLMVVKSQPGGCLNMQLKKEDLVAIKSCYTESLKKYMRWQSKHVIGTFISQHLIRIFSAMKVCASVCKTDLTLSHCAG